MSSSAAASGRRLPRGTLDATTIVDAAFLVVEDMGVEGLTVPAVARRLGVRPTAVHWHFRRKEDLLDALSAAALARFNARFPDSRGGTWQDDVAGYWSEYRQLLREHPVLCELIVVRWVGSVRSPGAVALHYQRIDRQIEVLISAGFTPEQAARAYHTLSTYTRGCLINERAAVASGDMDRHLDRPHAHLVVDAAHLPSLHQAAPWWTASFATDADFEAGLATIIAGLESLLPTT